MKNKNTLIFVHKFFKAIADSIIKVFIPLYLLKETGDLTLSFLYLTVQALTTFLLNLALRRFLQKYGIFAILLHFIPIVITEGILTFAKISLPAVILCGILMAFAQTLYSVPLNLIFAFGDKSTNVAKFQIATNVGKLLFMTFSGLSIAGGGEKSFLLLSLLSSLLYLICVIPIWFGYGMLKEEYRKHHSLVPKQGGLDRRFCLFHLFFGVFQVVMDEIIPLYLFINHLSFEAVTLLLVLVELCKIGTNYLSKILLEHGLERYGIILSVAVYIASLIAILFWKNSIALYVFSCLCAITFPMTFVPLFKRYCLYLSDCHNIFDGILVRDIYIFTLRPVYYALFLSGVGFPVMIAAAMINAGAMLKTELSLTK